MKFHFGYYVRKDDLRSSYHYSRSDSPRRTICGLGGSNWGEERNAFTAQQHWEKWGKREKSAENGHRRYCKTCLRAVRNARDIVTRLAEIGDEQPRSALTEVELRHGSEVQVWRIQQG